jgi:hypothetical protein
MPGSGAIPRQYAQVAKVSISVVAADAITPSIDRAVSRSHVLAAGVKTAEE